MKKKIQHANYFSLTMKYFISLRWEVWVRSTSLTPPLYIEMPVPSQTSEPSYLCVLVVSVVSLFIRFFYLILELLP